MENITEISFQIILYAGNGKSNAREATQKAKAGNFAQADQLIEEAGEELGKAHHYQTQLMHKGASGEKNTVTVMLNHSQDHVMTAMKVRDIAVKMTEIYHNR